MNRLLLYVHFNKFGTVNDHVIFQLQKMRPLFSKVIVLSNSIVSQEDRERLQDINLFDEFIQRTNTGFDFAAWQEGFSHVGFDNLAQFDNVTIMNDTTFGPLYDMNEIYDKYDRDETIDFWGITNHQAYEKFPEHIQSYFISFKNKIIISNVFLNFWKKMQASNNVQDIIDSYETQFTKMLVDAGFTYDTVLNTIGMDYLPSQTPDFSYFRPDVILFNKAPFIKVKTIALRQDVAPYVIDYLKRKTEYPTHLIIDHMSRIDIPDYPYLLAEKTLDKHLIYQPNDKTVAIHLHVYYVELLSEFLTKFDSFSFVYDLFITTDNEDKEKEIIQILSIHKLSAKVVVTGNVGRDIFPMLLLKDELASYDIIGHFHTKKSVEADFFAGESWRTELFEMLIDTADASVQSLSDNKNLGIVIADIPTFFRFNKIVDANNEATMVPAMTELWQRMNLSKEIDFNQLHTFTMSYGTFFWAKYDAIKPLFDLKLSAEEIPKEPLPQNSILHAMERLLVYVAWANNYDFIISLNKQITPFIDNKKLNIRLAPQLKEIIKQQQVTPKYLFQIMKKIAKKLLNKVKKI